MRRSSKLLTALGMAAATVLTVSAEDVDDSKFLSEAMLIDQAEVRMGQLAQQRGSGEGVREYGEKLEADHSRALEKTSALAKELGVPIPTGPKAEALEQYAALEKLSGQAFDTAFVGHMVMGHEKALELYTAQTHANPNKEIMAFATERLPTLREHLAIARSLQTPEAQGAHGAQHHAPDPQLRTDPTSPSSR
jgi:putative membrane protein